MVTCSDFAVSIFIIPFQYSHFQLKNLDQGVGKFIILLVYTHSLNIQSLTLRINKCALFLFSEIENQLNSGIRTICLKFSTLTHCHTSLGYSAQLTHLRYSNRIDPRSRAEFTGWTVVELNRSSSKKSLSQHHCRT